ncbi:MAG: type II toxin-antitoxin system RelE/ParE family toxin [Terracidiphilus sp.]|jgi:mRNA interferase RelE/StbE
MAWRIEYSKDAYREIAKLDLQIAQRIIRFMGERVAKLENPRSIGEALAGSMLGNYWKYRVGDYRIIADIQDSKLCVQVVRLGNRREVYR